MKASLFLIVSSVSLCFCGDSKWLRPHDDSALVRAFTADDSLPDNALSTTRERREVASGNEVSIDLSNDTFDGSVSTVVHLNDSNDHVLVHWAGKGSPVLVCLTKIRNRKTNMSAQNEKSNVYFSYDYGSTYIKAKLKLENGEEPLIDKFYISLPDNNRFIFADITNKHVFSTRNSGKSFNSTSVKFRPDYLSLHKTSSDLILGTEKNDSHGNLWFSDDFGEHWTIVQSDIKWFSWGTNEDEESTVFVQKCPNNVCTLKSFSHKFKKNEKDWLDEVIDVKVDGKYLFATRYAKFLGSRSENTPPLELWVSYDRKAFKRTHFPFPSNIRVMNYHIVDSDDDQIMVAVTFNDSNTNLFVSDVKRTRFTLSLRHIVYLNYSSLTKGAPKLDEASVDLHKVDGLTAIYIANRWKSHPQDGNKSLEKTESVITFNRGGTWLPLRVPTTDSNGQTIKCDTSKNCSLHLTQKYKEFSIPMKNSQTVSKASAVGIISATGNIGDSLKTKTNVYFSTDAGLNWKEVLTGNYILGFGDYGGIVVALNVSARSSGVNTLEYSLDTGTHWVPLKFLKNDEKIKVYGLMTEPGEKTATFTLFGSSANSPNHAWILVKINFTSLFDGKCKSIDYEEWSPQGPSSACFLGRKEIIKRRKPQSKCLNDVDYIQPVFKENCSCGYDDFECDFGFVRSEFDERKCIRDKSLEPFMPLLLPEPCEPGTTYFRTRGYMKITGDSCEGGLSNELGPVLAQCPVAKESGFLVFTKKLQSSHISLMLVIIILTAFLGLMVARHRRLRRSFLSFVNSHYDTRSDSATILVTDEGLDEEDTPIIRGFADDEPLVLA